MIIKGSLAMRNSDPKSRLYYVANLHPFFLIEKDNFYQQKFTKGP